ncbi:unnamed protein product [Closterium sp. Yama58-4]|nr:unnamed protein product [Closterium sp. Yama58-4]
MTGRVAGLEAMLREKEQESHELRRQLLAITRALEEGSHADMLSRAELLNQVLSLANQVKELSDERAALLSAPGGVAFNYGLGSGSKKSVASEKAPDEQLDGELGGGGNEEEGNEEIEDKPDEPAAAEAARVSSYRPPPPEALTPASVAEEEDHGTEVLSSAPSMTPSRPGTSHSSRSQLLIPRSYTMPVLAASGPSSQSRLSALPMSIVPYDPATAAENMANVTAPMAGAIVPYQPPDGSLVAGEGEGSESAVVAFMPPAAGTGVRSNPFDRPNTYEMNRSQASGPSAKPSRVQSFVPTTVPETAAEGATSGLGAMRGAIATLIRCGTRPEVREIQIRHLEKLNRSKRVTPEDIFAAIQSRCLTILAQVEPPSGFNILGVKVKIPRKLASISSISLTSTSSASTTPSNIRVTDSEAKFLTSPSVELVAFLFAAVVTHAWAPIECFPAIMEQMDNMYVRRLLIVDFLDAAFKRVGRLGVDALVQDLRGIDRLLGVKEERLPSVKELSNCKVLVMIHSKAGLQWKKKWVFGK